ncbi:MAG: hypothetical protein M1825_001148 [Sarcosagium campestre]|nr:MAG: hypothetical protein M1825_001148 [Sarcosagium campestre]
MDVTEMVEFNTHLINDDSRKNSFFVLSADNNTEGFQFDGSSICDNSYPRAVVDPTALPTTDDGVLYSRLLLGSHLANYLRQSLLREYGFTCTVGISTSKLLAKLVGNMNKPDGQTTLVPPYYLDLEDKPGEAGAFIDSHDIGRIPGIGFKLAQKIRKHVLDRPADFDQGLIYGGTRESVTVEQVRCFPGMSPQVLEAMLSGPGCPQGIGTRIWGLLNGVDDSEVAFARDIPRQISLEDSYLRLDTLDQIEKELFMLAKSLIKRLHLDLLEDVEENDESTSSVSIEPTGIFVGRRRRWVAHPRRLRLSTRPRPRPTADGAQTRSFTRISRSAPMPNFVFRLHETVEVLAKRLVIEALLPLFRKLHPEKSGWNLSLVNVAATDLVEAAGGRREQAAQADRHIGIMFKRQESVLREWKIDDTDIPPDEGLDTESAEIDMKDDDTVGDEAVTLATTNDGQDEIMAYTQDNTTDQSNEWQDGEYDDNLTGPACKDCGATMPAFAMAAHERFHSLGA